MCIGSMEVIMEENSFQLQIISPDRVFFKDEIDMVEVRTTEGDIGVLKGHIPLTSILEPGIIKIRKNGEDLRAAMHSGFIKILSTKVTILAESCEWPNEIDIHRATQAKERAEKRLSNGKDINVERAEMSLRRSLIRLEIANKQK
jgi:F-type H+-transporting ATPase subunit epsilon